MNVQRSKNLRFARYFSRTGWTHLTLLCFVWLFAFPFFWMLFTSIKTDEELPDGAILPNIPTFRAASPYVKDPIQPTRPIDVPPTRWTTLLPQLTDIATKRTAELQSTLPKLRLLSPIDPTAHRTTAAAWLVNYAVGKLNKDLWTAPDATLISAYSALLTDDAIRSALHNSLATLDLLSFQLRTLDFHIHPLTNSPEFATSWHVDAGPAALVPTPTGTLLSYDFSHSSTPITLSHTFPLPNGVTPQDLHKLIFSVKSDDSWHGVTATLDLAGIRWQSARTTYLAQSRPMSFIFQPPTFDDQLLRPKNWISLVPLSQQATSNTQQATLRITITPSNTIKANYGKLIRNYLRAFDAVPFWHYIGNSILLVSLTTLGSLFSASFVAYAFARLHWPGRSLALVLLLSTMMLPPQVTMIPGFLIWRGLHWYNTLNPLWVPSFFGTAFFIFLMIQHMKTIPRELEEAARIDGLNAVQSWYYILLPNCKPTLAAIAILSFMSSWNEFLQPLIYLRDMSKFPIALGLYGLKVDQFNPEQPDWTLIMAGDILMVLPVIAVFFLFQRYFVQGMTMTGMKG